MTYLHSPEKWEAGGEKMKRQHSNGERRAERCAKGDARRSGEGQWVRKRESNGGRQIEMAGSGRKGRCVYMCERTSEREVK